MSNRVEYLPFNRLCWGKLTRDGWVENKEYAELTNVFRNALSRQFHRCAPVEAHCAGIIELYVKDPAANENAGLFSKNLNQHPKLPYERALKYILCRLDWLPKQSAVYIANDLLVLAKMRGDKVNEVIISRVLCHLKPEDRGNWKHRVCALQKGSFFHQELFISVTSEALRRFPQDKFFQTEYLRYFKMFRQRYVAEAQLERVVQENPDVIDDFELGCTKAHIYKRAGDLTRAREQTHCLLKMQPENLKCFELLFQIHLAALSGEEIRELLLGDGCPSKDKSYYWIKLIELLSVSEGEKLQELVSLAKERCQQKFHYKIDLKWAEILMAQGETEKAKDIIERAKAECPKSNLSDFYCMQGLINVIYCNDLSSARKSFENSLKNGKKKLCPDIFLARLDELEGRLKEAEDRIVKAINFFDKISATLKTHSNNKAKAYLEWIGLKQRNGYIGEVFQRSSEILRNNQNSPKIHARMIQLFGLIGEEAQFDLLSRVRTKFPLSVEILCQAARIYLNPQSARFNPSLAESYLAIAIDIRENYSESWVEFLKLMMLTHRSDEEIEKFKSAFLVAGINHGASLELLSPFRSFSFSLLDAAETRIRRGLKVKQDYAGSSAAFPELVGYLMHPVHLNSEFIMRKNRLFPPSLLDGYYMSKRTLD